MGDISTPKSALLLVAATSRYPDALQLGREQCEARFGATQLTSDVYDFTETDYYDGDMGGDLKKQFWAFDVVDPGRLATIKRQTNHWEAEYAALKIHPASRPLNLDPGYLTLAKLVLASTKDHAHRIYIADGIYAEVTLSFRKGRWQHFPWTYPDYRREELYAFLTQCRDLLPRVVRQTRTHRQN